VTEETNLEDLIPERPNADGIPDALKAQPFWCCWEYHADEGYVTRRQIEGTGPWVFNVAYAAAQGHDDIGIGLILDDGPYVAVEIVADEYDSAYQAFLSWNTYLEHNDAGNGVTAIAEATIPASKSSQHVRIINSGFIPITGASINNIEPAALQREINHFVSSLFIPTWMDGLPEKPNEDELYDQLKNCLSFDGWLDYPIETRLYEFLSKCWDYPHLKVEILRKLKEGYRRKAEIDAFISAVETEQAKRKFEKRTELSEPVESEGKDRAEIEAIALNTPGRPTIIHDPTDITSAVDATLNAMVKDGADLWQRDGIVVSIQRTPNDGLYGAEEEGERLKISLVNIMYIVELATRAANHYVPYKYLKNQQFYKPGSCPKTTAEHIIARMSLPLRPLTNVVTVPTIRADGSIISEPGYDEATGIFYDPMGVEYPPIPDQPTSEETQAALAEIRGVFKDFWFAQDYDESATLAGIFTIMTRHLYNNAPLLAISSSTQGIGKTLLGRCMAMIGTGEEHPIRAYPKSDEEMEKRLLVSGMRGEKVIFWDNIFGVFGSSALDLALTGNFINGRILQYSKDADVRLQAVYIATGNNMKFRSDLSRRILPIMLEAKTQNPEERDDIEQEGLDLWCLANQPRLHAACLTLLRAYVVAGRPNQGLRPYGSFEAWSALVRSCVHWLGLPDPCIGRKSIQDDSDMGFDDLQNLLSAWHLAFPGRNPLKLKEIIDKVKTEERIYRQNSYYTPTDGLMELGEALLAYDVRANGRIQDISVTRLSHRLPINGGQSRIIEGLRLRSIQDKSKRTKSFWIENINSDSKAEGKISISDYDDDGLTYEVDNDKESDVPF